MWIKFLGILGMLMLFVGITSAQVPPAVSRALEILNAESGQAFALGDIFYSFSEGVFNGDNLGCTTVSANDNLSRRAYVVSFETDGDGIDDWVIHVASDLSLSVVCLRPRTVEPNNATPIPAQPTATPSACDGLAPRLQIGTLARVAPGDPNIVRGIPSRNGAYVTEIAAGTEFSVVDGPRCSDGFTWWQINVNGTIGWTVEGRDGLYFLEPATVAVATPEVNTSTREICNASVPPRLWRGQQGYVNDGDSNRVRATPGTGGELVGEIAPGTRFGVLEDYVCADGLTWWRVVVNEPGGLIGWTAEGSDGEYWLEPVNAAFDAITASTPITQVGTLVAGTSGFVVGDYDTYHWASNDTLYAIGGNTTAFVLPSNFDMSETINLSAPFGTESDPVYDLLGAMDLYRLQAGIDVTTLSPLNPSESPSPFEWSSNEGLAFESLLADIAVYNTHLSVNQFQLLARHTGSTNEIEVWQLGAPPTRLGSVSEPDGVVRLGFTANGLLVVRNPGTLKVYRVIETGLELLSVAVAPQIEAQGGTNAVSRYGNSFSANAEYFVTNMDATTLGIYSTTDLTTPIVTVPTGGTLLGQAVFSPRTLTVGTIIGNADNTTSIFLYSLDTQRSFVQPLIGDYTVPNMVFSPDGRFIIAINADSTSPILPVVFGTQ
jgi:hypothetical protein